MCDLVDEVKAALAPKVPWVLKLAVSPVGALRRERKIGPAKGGWGALSKEGGPGGGERWRRPCLISGGEPLRPLPPPPGPRKRCRSETQNCNADRALRLPRIRSRSARRHPSLSPSWTRRAESSSPRP